MIIPVVAAVIFEKGRVLICQRRAGDSLGLKWEFPGGKVHSGESLHAALARELEEELGVAATVGDLLRETEFTYGQIDRAVHLSFFRACLPEQSALQNLAFEKILWELPEKLPAYDFLPADREIVALIASGEIAAS